MRIQDPVWKECYIEMNVDHGMFTMSAAVRLLSLLEMYAVGFLLMAVFLKFKKRWRENHG